MDSRKHFVFHQLLLCRYLKENIVPQWSPQKNNDDPSQLTYLYSNIKALDMILNANILSFVSTKRIHLIPFLFFQILDPSTVPRHTIPRLPPNRFFLGEGVDILRLFHPPSYSFSFSSSAPPVFNWTRVVPSSCISMLVFRRFLARDTSWSVTLVQIRILDKQKKKQILQQLPYIVVQLETSEMKDPITNDFLTENYM